MTPDTRLKHGSAAMPATDRSIITARQLEALAAAVERGGAAI